MNVLLLREKVKLPPMLEQITANQLLTYLGECLTDSVPDDIRSDENALLNFEQNIHDAIEIIPKLKTGLDVNIRFSGITEFEYTPECIIFDILRIPLYHGWLSDPELKDTIGKQSYNQLVDYIIANKPALDPEVQARVMISEDFLAQTASQLTVFGLNELKTKINDNEIGILFRNNHFLTLFKREGELYTLVTDHGYLTEDNIIWETLDNIEGDGRFFDANFQLARISANSKQATAMSNIDEMQKQVLEDYLMALELEREDSNRQAGTTTGATADTNVDLGPVPMGPGPTRESISGSQLTAEDDFELARRLQDEENRIYEEMVRGRQSRGPNDQSWAVMERVDNSSRVEPSLQKGVSQSVDGENIQVEDQKQPANSQDQSSSSHLISDQESCHSHVDRQMSIESQSNQKKSCPKESAVGDCSSSQDRMDVTLEADPKSSMDKVPEDFKGPIDQRSSQGENETPSPLTSSTSESHGQQVVNPVAMVGANTGRQHTSARSGSEKSSKDTNCIIS